MSCVYVLSYIIIRTKERISPVEQKRQQIKVANVTSMCGDTYRLFTRLNFVIIFRVFAGET